MNRLDSVTKKQGEASVFGINIIQMVGICTITETEEFGAKEVRVHQITNSCSTFSCSTRETIKKGQTTRMYTVFTLRTSRRKVNAADNDAHNDHS